MIHSQRQSRQPAREAWSRDKLLRERAIALGQATDSSTQNSYSSALNSYLNFVRLHNLPVEPTVDTLSLYAVYMSHHINPRSVTSHLSDICQQLEPYFPNVRQWEPAVLLPLQSTVSPHLSFNWWAAGHLMLFSSIYEKILCLYKHFFTQATKLSLSFLCTFHLSYSYFFSFQF